MSALRLAAALACLVPAAFAADPAAYAAAVELYAQRKPVEAQAAFAALAAADPANADVHFYLGRLALQRDDHEEARRHLERAVALAPTNSRMQHRLGDAYGRAAQKAGLFAKLGWAAKCLAAYERAVALDPANVDARFSLMGFYLQAPALAGGSPEKALAQAAAIKELDSYRGALAAASAHAASQRFDLAFAEYEAALRIRPGDYAALFQLGRLAAVSGQQADRGLAALRACLAQPTPEGQPGHAQAQWRLGAILERQGDAAGARAAYEAARQLDPGFAPAAESLRALAR
ncbi:MAG: tetratricopeptide repeat protein [Opitutaceae bacterium]|nr:tetratricopeptide repeat protein [Opitutaceae bacterium]